MIQAERGALSGRKSAAYYIQAYGEVENLLPDFEMKLKDFADAYEEARKVDERRGFINTQFFYKSHKSNN